jgi:hypothetical protein
MFYVFFYHFMPLICITFNKSIIGPFFVHICTICALMLIFFMSMKFKRIFLRNPSPYPDEKVSRFLESFEPSNVYARRGIALSYDAYENLENYASSIGISRSAMLTISIIEMLVAEITLLKSKIDRERSALDVFEKFAMKYADSYRSDVVAILNNQLKEEKEKVKTLTRQKRLLEEDLRRIHKRHEEKHVTKQKLGHMKD